MEFCMILWNFEIGNVMVYVIEMVYVMVEWFMCEWMYFGNWISGNVELKMEVCNWIGNCMYDFEIE